MALGERAAQWLQNNGPRDDPAASSLLGMLHLRAAVAAARHQDRPTAANLLDRAEQAAEVVGRDANLWMTGFGPTNVRVHRMAVALDLGDVAIVAERGATLDASSLPMERRVTLLIDVGRAQTLLGRDEDALSTFLQAEGLAAQLVRHSTVVRESVRRLYRRAGHTGRSTRLLGLAERCRAVA